MILPDDYLRIRYRDKPPGRPHGDAGLTTFLGRAAADSQANGAFTPIYRVTVTGDEIEGASPILTAGSETSLAFPIRDRLSEGQYVPVGWSGYRWSCPVQARTVTPTPPPSGCPDPDPDVSLYRFRLSKSPTDGPYPMHWDAALDAWVGQVDLQGEGEWPGTPLWNPDICGDYDPNSTHSYDPGGFTTLGVALRRITRPALLTAQVSEGRIVGVTIDDPGCGYNYWLNNYSDSWGIRFTGGGGQSAWVVARTDVDSDGQTVPYEQYQYGGIASVTVFNGGTGYTSPPAAEVVTPDGWIDTRVISCSIWRCNGGFGGPYYIAHSGTGWVPTPPGSIYANRSDPECDFMLPDIQDGFYMGWTIVPEDCNDSATTFGGFLAGCPVIIERDWVVRLQGVSAQFAATVTP